MTDAVVFSSSRISARPSAQQVVGIATKSGYLEKKNNSWWAFFLPWLFGRYKRRFFVLAGSFLFKYASEHGETPKGIPIPLASCEVGRREEDPSFIEIRTVRKKYSLRAPSADVANDWIMAIRTRKYEAIKEEMGHASLAPTTERLNKAANSLYLEKLSQESMLGDSSTMNPMLV